MTSPTSNAVPVHVAAAVITNAQGEVLISLRHAQLHQGGLWEFPGGKVEPGEEVYAALARELHEELGVTVQAARPLIRIPHAYPDKQVLLDVWQVTIFSGTPHGREGQPIRWVAPDKLVDFAFPAANQPIVTAARLPDRYLITPEPDVDFLDQLKRAFQSGIRLVQLRAKSLDTAAYRDLARNVCELAHAQGARVLLNADPAVVLDVGADGVHLTTARLAALSQRPLPTDHWVAASCHNAAELRQATAIGCDFAVLGPVQSTASHPGASYLGWEGFQVLADNAVLPVYALGGMQPPDQTRAWGAGAQGIAAIRSLWPASV
ncbi:MAG: Nudix family hydrolase [Gammaproteobacteria bacterium]|nr:Nudix family hydrolase [Gammaproteobacteria bacterium]